MRVRAFGVVGALFLGGCAGGTVTTAQAVAPGPTEAAFIEQVVDQVSGARPDLRRVRLFVASDGSRVACGDWTAPDGIGTTEWASFYIRWRDGVVQRVHLDDATGFGPAILGCNQAEAGLLRISG